MTAAKTRYPLISITCSTHRGHVIFGRRTLTIVNAVNVSNIVEGEELQEDTAIKNRGLTNLGENVQEAFTVKRWIKSDAHFDTEPPFQLGGASFDTGSTYNFIPSLFNLSRYQ